jgi:hypothetical protein
MARCRLHAKGLLSSVRPERFSSRMRNRNPDAVTPVVPIDLVLPDGTILDEMLVPGVAVDMTHRSSRGNLATVWVETESMRAILTVLPAAEEDRFWSPAYPGAGLKAGTSRVIVDEKTDGRAPGEQNPDRLLGWDVRRGQVLSPRGKMAPSSRPRAADSGNQTIVMCEPADWFTRCRCRRAPRGDDGRPRPPFPAKGRREGGQLKSMAVQFARRR